MLMIFLTNQLKLLMMIKIVNSKFNHKMMNKNNKFNLENIINNNLMLNQHRILILL
jgi:hypothetical protein